MLMLTSQTAASQSGEVPGTENTRSLTRVNEDYLTFFRIFSDQPAYQLKQEFRGQHLNSPECEKAKPHETEKPDPYPLLNSCTRRLCQQQAPRPPGAAANGP